MKIKIKALFFLKRMFCTTIYNKNIFSKRWL
nr:MAG TPA: hypothetical protein [Herelleviridae sp.]